jgi:hypothetical protein
MLQDTNSCGDLKADYIRISSRHSLLPSRSFRVITVITVSLTNKSQRHRMVNVDEMGVHETE